MYIEHKNSRLLRLSHLVTKSTNWSQFETYWHNFFWEKCDKPILVIIGHNLNSLSYLKMWQTFLTNFVTFWSYLSNFLYISPKLCYRMSCPIETDKVLTNFHIFHPVHGETWPRNLDISFHQFSLHDFHPIFLKTSKIKMIRFP